MKIIKLFYFSLLCLMALSVNAQYVDLGLPSGTKWKSGNETGGKDGFYTCDEALTAFGDQLPTKEQCLELIDSCIWEWTGREYKVTGPNGKYIFMPASGNRSCRGTVNDVGIFGHYWTSSPIDSDYAWDMHFGSDYHNIIHYDRCFGHSVRLVANP